MSVLSLLLADSTGEYSVYTEFRDAEVMFHISTLLPFTPTNKQQVNREISFLCRAVTHVHAISSSC